MRLVDGLPCSHTGCLNHITHPCDGCGRIGGDNSTLPRWDKSPIEMMWPMLLAYDCIVTKKGGQA